MSLRDKQRAGQALGCDEPVKKALAAWSKERDSDVGRINLKRAAARLEDNQRRQLVERLAEIALAVLFVLEKTQTSKEPET